METFCCSCKIVSPNTQLNHVWYKNHMDFMYYANEDGTSYLFTRDYYYKKGVSAGLFDKAKGLWPNLTLTSIARSCSFTANVSVRQNQLQGCIVNVFLKARILHGRPS
ncbi:hypothetical protein AVEN_61623-1 [Araneus ventricosus]|uniref:Uncharacterized protein n=1 Tax=Araneus ventricosus TaxID=182803 RepID=A0A4Y2HIX6_ARAVE|nr:hypothetical protein AVEN_61623-1 [Araneus ventricosus]